jgi:uncharacterized membrane protein YkoI
VRNRFPGEVARVKIEREGKRLVYELRIVDIQGRLFEIHVDAATGAIGRTKEE